MAKTVQVTLEFSVIGDGANFFDRYVMTGNTLVTSPFTGQATANGSVTVTVPSNVTHGVLIAPPTGSTLQKTYKGVAGDTGIVESTTNGADWVFLPVTSGSIVITATAVEQLLLIWC